MKQVINSKIAGKKVLILGLGIEGSSTYRFLRKTLPDLPITLSDQRIELRNIDEFRHVNTIMNFGENYLRDLESFDVVIKSPGIPENLLPASLSEEKLTSQTELFLEAYRNQTIGITGTKGKSTTASLTHHLLNSAGYKSLLVGNIGLPPFDVIDRIQPETLIVFELSAHQLENVKVSPHIAVLLNIYQEHLDHFKDFRAYQLAKFNIAKWQTFNDFLIYPGKEHSVVNLINLSTIVSNKLTYGFGTEPGLDTCFKDDQIFLNTPDTLKIICDLTGIKFLPGKHNQLNLMAAFSALIATGVADFNFCNSLSDFRSLQHRLEFIGTYNGKRFYNDSIATIPEAVIYALDTIKDIDCLLLGGYDRGIDYSKLVDYLADSEIPNFFFTGDAGKRMMSIIKPRLTRMQHCKWFKNFDEMVREAIKSTSENRACLLSPAAASYDEFMNFEHRGNRFRELVNNWFQTPER
ncbi:MAG: UDP-N-acetylmuramoyl-L-alanine--D-glutamate ligase [Bacteroidales bacterium]